MLLVILLFSLIAPLALAQTVTGTLIGQVADRTGAVIPNAKITIVNTSTGAVRDAQSNESGYFQVSFLQLGTYNVTVAAAGFRSVEKKGVTIALNQNTVSDFALEVAGTSTSVEVKGGEIPLIDTTTGALKDSLDAHVVENTPIAGRNFISLVEQIPGFQPSAFNTSSNNPTNSTGSYASFNGQGTRSTTFQIDGVNNDDSSENQNRNGVNPSTIKEFQVLTNSYTAEFGRAGGAVILVQTKSGTNGFHGDAYDYIQNDIFNANDFFVKEANGKRAPVRRNNYGGTIGGPIFKDKLFFFGSADRVSSVGKGSMSRFTWLPTDTPHACAPGEVSKPGGPYCVDPATHPNIQRDLAFMNQVMSLWNTPELKGKTPNDPQACAQLIASGRPNRCVLVTGLGFSYPRSDYTGRFDWTASTSTNMNIRYQYSRQQDVSPRIIEGDNYGTNNNRQYNVGYTLTHVFSPRQTGEFRFGFGNRNTNQQVTDGNDIPTLRFGSTSTTLTNPANSSDFMNFVPGTVIGTSLNVPILRRQRDYQLVYNHTLVLGRHTFRAGIDQRLSALDDVASGGQRGYWTFGTYSSTAAIAAGTGFTSWEMFLMGIVTGYQRGYGLPYAQNRFDETNLYLEDSFRVKPTLTLYLGTRWEGVGAPREAQNRFQYGFGSDYNNVEPRIGFAWTPSKSSGLLSKLTGTNPGDFVIRGGYGFYHGRIFQSVFSQSGTNYRFQPPNGFNYGGPASPCAVNGGGTLVDPSFGNRSIGGGNFEISDPSCGYTFVPGTAARSLPSTGGGVKNIGGMLSTTLLQVDPGFHVPYTEQYNFTIERKLPGNMALQIAYNGNHGFGLPFFSLTNLSQFGIASPLVSADVGGGVYKPIVFDKVCVDYSDPMCVVNNADGSINQAASGALRTFTATITSTSATLAQKGIVIIDGVPHGYISANTLRAAERRPDPTMGNNYRLSNFARTYYNAMLVKLTKSMSHGLTFTGWWQWSKTMDTGSETTTTNTDLNYGLGTKNQAYYLRALSSYDQPQKFSISASYDTPWMKNQAGVLGRMVGGWTLSGVGTFASGLPFTIYAGYDVNMDGVSNDYPVLVDRSVLGRSIDNGHQMNPCPSGISAGRCLDTLSQSQINPAAFLPLQGSLGLGNSFPLAPGVAYADNVARRNSFREQGQRNIDMAINKSVKVREQMALALRFELYNVFNRTTFGIPARTVNSSTPLGRISSDINLTNFVNSARANGNRMGQFALRFTF